ncbi:Uma2 family endonuclease [Mucilaginibacter arboris]|uniref:Uma2 family endonuclease n=1 Tax=Mucilaginibacter arboris TaxID=2682090 RepID=A0A7K1SSL2_9SPHI|nr:Uma2 family endonuclease [Mucilaginibacter arboris]MVN20090.1 Uma2 family endonuclease [Mucilaginibacter arboris]
MPVAEKKKYTELDYHSLEVGPQFQLIDGEKVMPPIFSLNHQLVNGKLFMLISQHLEKNGLGGLCLFYPVDVVLDEKNTFQPDLIYISNESKVELLYDRIHGAPDLVIETLSPATAYYDLIHKKDFYERYGVKEYLIIDPLSKNAEVYVLNDKQFILQQKEHQNGTITLNTLPGLQIDLQKLFS